MQGPLRHECQRIGAARLPTYANLLAELNRRFRRRYLLHRRFQRLDDHGARQGRQAPLDHQAATHVEPVAHAAPGLFCLRDPGERTRTAFK